MNNYETLKDKMNIIGMDEVEISTDDKPIIGTDSLGPCVGLLIYCPGKKRAIVAHAPADWKHLVPQIFFLMYDNDLMTPEQYKSCDEIFGLFEHYDLYSFPPHLKDMVVGDKKKVLIPDSKENKLVVTIIPGYYQDHYNITTDMENLFDTLTPLFTINREILPKRAINTRDLSNGLKSREFAFNADTGKFVTAYVLTDKQPEESIEDSYRIR